MTSLGVNVDQMSLVNQDLCHYPLNRCLYSSTELDR